LLLFTHKIFVTEPIAILLKKKFAIQVTSYNVEKQILAVTKILNNVTATILAVKIKKKHADQQSVIRRQNLLVHKTTQVLYSVMKKIDA